MAGTRQTRTGSAISLLALVGAMAAACSSGGTEPGGQTGDSCELPATVKVAVVKDQTGNNSAVGIGSLRGIEIALAEVEAQGLLGNTRIELDVKDTANSPQTAASHVTGAAADRSIAAVLGPVISDQAQATAPIANSRQIPIIFNQAGSQGVVTGDWTFRVSPPLPTYYGQVVEALKAKDVKKLGIISASDNPTLIELAEVLKEEAEANGIEVLAGSTSVPQTLQDFSGPVSKLMEESPDAVAALVFGANFAGLRQALTQAGFTGMVVAFPGVVISIATVADQAVGTTWPTNFSAAAATGVGKAFAEAYEKEYGETPNNYAAEGYDSLMWLVKALTTENCATREAIRDGLIKVANEGFEGAQGTLTFADGHDARTVATLVQWDGTAVVPFAG